MPGTPNKAELQLADWYRLKHRRAIVVVLVTLSIVIGLTSSLMSEGNEFSDLSHYSALDYYSTNGLTISPGTLSEIWLVNDDLWLYGKVSCTRSNPEISSIVIEGVPYNFTSESIALDTTQLGIGERNVTVIISETVDDSFLIHITNTNRFFQMLSKASDVVFPFALCVSFSGLLILLWVFFPLQIELNRRKYFQVPPDLSVPDGSEVDFLMQRTDQLRNSIAWRVDYYLKRKSMLLTLLAILLAGYGTALSLVISSLEDYWTESVLIASFLVGFAAFLIPITILLSEHDKEWRKDSRTYHHNIMISTPFDIRPLNSEIQRVHKSIVGKSKEEHLIEGIRESLLLYYSCNELERQCSRAIRWVPIATFLLALSIFTGLWADSWITPYISIVYPLSLSVLLLIMFIFASLNTFFVDFSIPVLSLYRGSTAAIRDEEWNRGVGSIDSLMSRIDIQVKDTDGFQESDRILLQKTVKSNTTVTGRPATKRQHLYGPQKGDYSYCGVGVPILVIERVGSWDKPRILPYCENDGSFRTIESYLKEIINKN